MRHRCHIAPAEAAARATVTEAITAGPLQTTGTAMRTGSMSWRHAATIESTLKDIPAGPLSSCRTSAPTTRHNLGPAATAPRRR
jgi:hypothetical protein